MGRFPQERREWERCGKVKEEKRDGRGGVDDCASSGGDEKKKAPSAQWLQTPGTATHKLVTTAWEISIVPLCGEG